MYASPTVYLTQTDGVPWPQWLTESGLQRVEPDTLAARLPRRQPLTVVISPFWGALHRVALPTRDYQKAIAATPFALEEQLNGDIAQRVFVLGHKPADDGRWAVLVLDRDRVEQIRSCLEQWGVAQARLCHPLSLWPRPAAGRWRVYQSACGQRFDVVDEHGCGFVLPVINPAQAFTEIDRFAQADGVTEVEWAVDMPLPSAPMQLHSEHLQVAALDERGWQLPEGRLSPVLSLTVDPAGLHEQGGKKRAMVSLAVLGVAVLLYPVLQLIAETQKAQQLSNQVAADFAIAMPDTRMVNPRVQVQPLLTPSATRKALPAVAQLGQLSRQLEQMGVAAEVTALHYADGQWRWHFKPNAVAVLSNWPALAGQAGFHVHRDADSAHEVTVFYEGDD